MPVSSGRRPSARRVWIVLCTRDRKGSEGPSIAMNGSARYDGATIWLHWITAALVAFLWASGQIGDDLPKTLRAGVWSLHVLFGIALGSVLIARLAWRTQFGRVLPAANAGLL